MSNGKTKISKRDFYELGGLANPRLFRKMRGGAWTYWEIWK